MTEDTFRKLDAVSIGSEVIDSEEDIMDPRLRQIDDLKNDGGDCLEVIEDCCNQKDARSRRIMSQNVAGEIIKFANKMYKCLHTACKIAAEELTRADCLDRSQQYSASFALPNLEESLKEMEKNIVVTNVVNSIAKIPVIKDYDRSVEN